MRAELEAALAAARAAGAVLRRHFRAGVAIHYKRAADPVTAADREAERTVAAVLTERFPDHGFLGEEGEVRRAAPVRWIVDPLDGTTNFSRGLERFCVAIALEREGRVELGVIHDPLRGETFHAVRGEGAWCGDRPIRVSATDDLCRAVVASGFPYDAWESRDDNTAEWRAMVKRVQAVRCLGASALDLAHVACGRLDLFWERGLDPWDQAAGALLVTEAGGRVTDLGGSPFDPHRPAILASNGRLHDLALAVLATAV